MKILLISHAYVVSENQQKLETLGKIKGIELLLFAPSCWKDSLRTVKLEKEKSENYKIISSNVFFNGKISIYFFAGRLKKVLKEFKPDIIHIEEEPWSFVAFQLMLYKKILKLKSKIIFFTWENIYRKYRFINNLTERYFLGNADYAIAGNEEARHVLMKKGFIEDRISVIPQTGVDVERFKKINSSELRRKLGIKEFSVGFIGRLAEEKGISTLLDAYLKIKDKAQLLFIGNGQMKGYISDFINKNNLSGKIIIVESVKHDEIPLYLNCMDIMVLPSITTASWKEQFGHVIIEAFACGVAVIGSNSGAIAEVIGDAGLIFKEKDENDLVKQIEFLMNNEKEREKSADAGRKRAEESYTNEKIAGKTSDIYKNLLN